MKKRTSLVTELMGIFAGGFVLALVTFFLLYNSFHLLLEDFFRNSSFVQDAQQKYRKSLQEYVTENDLAATDFSQLRLWSEENGITIFSVSRERVLLFDNAYVGNAPLVETDSLQLHRMWQFFQKIEFADGAADVYIYKNYGRNLYLAGVVCAAVLSALAWILFFICCSVRKVKYIRKLQQEALSMSKTHLESGFSQKGNDELTDLAEALDQMRTTILEDARREETLAKERQSLVLGLAHDLRTPLTGLLGYLEICKRLDNVSDRSIAYIDKAMRKAMQIRELSDNLFDCFLSSDSGSCHLEPPARAGSLLEDHFSEMFTQLECSGFSVDFSGLRWDDVLIQADLNFLGRIVNNMLSNLNKYADKKKIVLLSSACRGGYFGISVENAVKPV